MDINQQLDEARQAFYAASERLDDLEDEYRKTAEEQDMRAMIGRCFKYRNRLYVRVFDVCDRGLCVVMVEPERFGCREVRETLIHSFSIHYAPIDEAEYLAAVEPILDTIRERAGL